MIAFVVLAMFFCHIIDDFKLQQGVLCNMKQKAWWEENAPGELWRYDYIAALVIHAISWSFMILLPVALYFHFHVSLGFYVAFVINAAVHAAVDDFKANKRKINLITDQLLHAGQIILTAALLLM